MLSTLLTALFVIGVSAYHFIRQFVSEETAQGRGMMRLVFLLSILGLLKKPAVDTLLTPLPPCSGFCVQWISSSPSSAAQCPVCCAGGGGHWSSGTAVPVSFVPELSHPTSILFGRLAVHPATSLSFLTFPPVLVCGWISIGSQAKDLHV